MKIGRVTKHGKKHETTQKKKKDNDVASKNCDVIDIFCNLLPIWSNQEAGSACIVCKTYYFH